MPSFEDVVEGEIRERPTSTGQAYINWPMNEHFALGMILKRYIEREIDGRFTMNRYDGGAIAQAVSECSGDHLEIGSLYGGSAILAALTKKLVGQSGMVYSIDAWEFYEDQTVLGGDKYPSRDLARWNAKQIGVADRIMFYQQTHPPLPKELEDKRFDTAFIDANHMYDGALADWNNLRGRVNKYMLFHDILVLKYHEADVGKVFRDAAKFPEWEAVYCLPKMGVLRRVEDEE